MLRQQRLLLDGRPAMGAPDAGEHGRDMAVLAVEGQGPLGEIPHQRREPPLDRGDGPGVRACALGAGSERREIEADAFGVGEGLKVEALAGAPAQVVAPVGGVGAVGVLRRRRAGVGAGGLDQRLEPCREGGSARLLGVQWGRGPAHAGLMSVRAKSAPLNRRASPVALASA